MGLQFNSWLTVGSRHGGEVDVSVRRNAARAAFRVGLRDNQPKRNRVGRFAALILGAGAVSGIAAMLGVWPFAGLQVLVNQIVHGPPAGPIEARTLFPAVPPVHQVIDVYDPPPPAPPAAKPAPQPPQVTPTPRHEHPSPTPTAHSTPSPSPKGDD
jgi:hypothetical protein